MYEDVIMEKIDKRCEEILDDLGKTNMDEQSYTNKTKNLETLCRIKGDAETRDQTRLSNNAKNDLEEVRIQLENEKIKTQRLGYALSGIQTVFFGIASWKFCKISYNGDLLGMANRGIFSKANDMLSMAKTFIIRR